MVEWYIFAFGTALLVTAATLVEKKTLLKEHAMEFSTVLALFTLIFSLFMLPKANLSFSWQMWGIIILNGIVGGVAFLLAAKAIRHMELSLSSPLMSFGPAFTAALAFFVLGESLGMAQIGGIGLLVIGAYFLESDRILADVKKPFIRMFKSKYIHYIFFALILYAVSSVMDRYILTNGVDAISFIVAVHIVMATVFLVLISIFHNGVKGIIHGVKNAGIWIFVMSVLVLLSRLFYAYAASAADIGLVEALKRSSTLMTTIVGGRIFHEKRIGMRIIVGVIMVAGAVMVIL